MNFLSAVYKNFVVFDTETTGLNLAVDQICSFHAIELYDINMLKKISSLDFICDPLIEISKEASAVNGFVRNDSLQENNLKGLPSFGYYSDTVIEYLSGKALICHNAVFDIGFLIESLIPFVGNLDFITKIPYVICTKQSFASLLGKEINFEYVPGTSLDALCDFLGVDRTIRDTGHNAKVDTELTTECFKKLVEKYSEHIKVLSTREILDYLNPS